MKKLNVAIIGQGRSGKDIHGLYFRSESNAYFDVKYVVVSEDIYPGCRTFSDYTELFDIEDADLIVFDEDVKVSDIFVSGNKVI